jgi:putative hemolysin
MEVSMKKILLLTTVSGLALVGCSSSQINMSMGNMRLINSSAAPQDVMNFANTACKNDFYQGASFLSKAGKEYRFKCVKAEENEILIPIPGTTIPSDAPTTAVAK